MAHSTLPIHLIPLSAQQDNPTANLGPPPPYDHDAESDSDSDSDLFDEDEEDEPMHPNPIPTPFTQQPSAAAAAPAPIKLTINAAHSIHGSHNLVPTSPSPFAEAARFAAVLAGLVNQINNNANGNGNGTVKRKAPFPAIDLTINCGVTVTGDRNVVGHVGIKPKSPLTPPAADGNGAGIADAVQRQKEGMSSEGAAAVIGAKRKAEEDLDEERQIKKVAVEKGAE